MIGGGSDEDLLDGDPTVRFQFGLDLFIDGIRTRLNSIPRFNAHRIGSTTLLTVGVLQ